MVVGVAVVVVVVRIVVGKSDVIVETGGCEYVELNSIGSVVCTESVIKSSVFFSIISSTSSVVVNKTFVVACVAVGGVALAVDAINLLVEVDLVTGVVTRP